MKRHYLILIFLALGCFFACEPSAPKTEETTPSPIKEKTVIKTEPTKLTVNINNLRLRDAPGDEGKELAKLTNGTVLTDLGELSDFTTKINFRGVAHDEPWIKVKTAEGQSGWVYAGGLSFDLDQPSGLTTLLQEKRLQVMFGKVLTKAIFQYRDAYHGATTSQEFAKVFIEGQELRDSLVVVLEKKIPVNDHDQLPDLFWLEKSMPSFQTALVAEGTIYYLFVDFKEVMAKAMETEGEEDNEFAELAFQVHDMDSVEHFFPAWFMQTWDYGGHSLLGKGTHLSILQKMNTLHLAKSPFEPKIQNIKAALLSDIVEKHVSYWEPKDKILKELNAIIKEDFEVFSSMEKSIIKTRKKLFENPAANKIEVNQRSGM